MAEKKKGRIIEAKGVAHVPLLGGKQLGMLEPEEPEPEEEKEYDENGRS